MSRLTHNPFQELGFDPELMDIAVGIFKRGHNADGVEQSISVNGQDPVIFGPEECSYIESLATDSTDPHSLRTAAIGMLCVGLGHGLVYRNTLRLL